MLPRSNNFSEVKVAETMCTIFNLVIHESLNNEWLVHLLHTIYIQIIVEPVVFYCNFNVEDPRETTLFGIGFASRGTHL